MKRLLSLILALTLLISALTVFYVSADENDIFNEGDVLYLKIESPREWATLENTILYVSFTEGTRAGNGNKSVVIADADPSEYAPKTGVIYDSETGCYKYTVTAADAGAKVMRFWRGNTEKLWNESVLLRAEDLAAGRNTAVVTDWSNTGYLTTTGDVQISTEPTEPVEPPEEGAPAAFERNCLYAHAAGGADESEAWVKWYKLNNVYYFFMPSSAKVYDNVELYNSFNDTVIVNGTQIPANSSSTFSAKAGTTYHASVEVLDLAISIQFMFSSAEAALWVNNTESYSGYSDFFAYLKADKANSVSATGAVSTLDGTITNTEIKKMKGRGNTSWNADKKGFNVTFSKAVELAGMKKCKKFSLVSNFQDAAMARNRILFDLADAVEVPYSSDSRFIDLYTNGVYQGTYQMCEKVDVGANTLIDDFTSDDYLDAETGGVKSDFCFVAEIDSSPGADDFHFTVNNGNNLTMKAPELTADDANYNAVRTYIYTKYNAMYSNLQSGSINDYLDVNSMAKVYIINELGKNWDTGASSFYFTYKPDENGVYKFFASPVWDYDNSLGNARGVSGDLNRLGISDYTLPTGWFASKKNGYTGPNVLAESVKNPVIMAEVRRVWFEDFLPALRVLTSKTVSAGELYSSDVYADIIRDSAAMNYKIWELVTNSSWICDHGSLRKYSADYTYNQYGQVTGVSLRQDSTTTRYDQYTFDGQFDYMMDWTNSRAAWISAQYIADYVPSDPEIVPTEPETEPEPTLPPQDVIEPDLTDAIAAWVFDSEGKAEGDKLTEYGNSDGYAATFGQGSMTLTVSGEKGRALEWSASEYGVSGTLTVPIMAAGSKNKWGAPYVRFTVPARGYDGLKLTAYFAASNKTPAAWKLQYSMDGESFTDIDGAVFTVTADSRKALTAYFDKSMLPDFGYMHEENEVILQLVPVSMTTVAGGNTADDPAGGELAINYVVIQGREVTYDDVILGDADGSSEVDITDVTRLQRWLADMNPLTSAGIKAACVRGTEVPEVTDATVIQRALAGINNPFLNLG